MHLSPFISELKMYVQIMNWFSSGQMYIFPESSLKYVFP